MPTGSHRLRSLPLAARRAGLVRVNCGLRRLAAGFRTLACVGGLGLLAGGVFAAEPRLFRSQSGQFLVQGQPVGRTVATPASAAGSRLVHLDPAVLAVSLERIKQGLLTELRLEDKWRGTIYVALFPVQRDNEPVRVTSIRQKDRWNYRIELPELTRKDRFLKAVVQVLLLEIANRRSGERSAELPPWLGDGLLAHLRATSLATLTLEPQTSIVERGQRRDPLKGVRECLRTNTPLTLEELSWPTPAMVEGADAVRYRSCAHLFVAELLRLKHGSACLRDLLVRLPQHRNWQFAFLEAFRAHFQRLLDVDKWWALNLVDVTGKDLFSLWPQFESWARLEEILMTPVEVRVKSSELPLTTKVKLQTVMAEWDLAKQLPVLQQKRAYLQALRLRVVPVVAGLVDDYYRVLDEYARGQKASGPPNPERLREAVRLLTALDAQRELLQRQFSPTQARANPSRRNPPPE